MSCFCFDLGMIMLFQYVTPRFTELLHKQQQHRRRLQLIEEYNGGIEDIDEADDVFSTAWSTSIYTDNNNNNTGNDDDDEYGYNDSDFDDEHGTHDDIVARQSDTDDERQSLLNQSSVSGASDPILREQDEAYLRTLERDQERERQRQEEEEQEAIEEAMEASKKEWRNQERQRKADKVSQMIEPEQNDESAISVLFKLPDGTRIRRRFHEDDTFQDLFDYIDAEADIDPDHYAIATSYPRRKFTFSSTSDQQLKDADLGKQVAFFVEEIFQEN
eukprot:gb/GECH01014358.1/.p1 GENE.gb/GECH01014358.1/~~gb/GECH01014358.1/.p1  ORF type:complete len:274 (+),score=110.39 gb/GECH01014358.1/:1-822(+)